MVFPIIRSLILLEVTYYGNYMSIWSMHINMLNTYKCVRHTDVVIATNTVYNILQLCVEPIHLGMWNENGVSKYPYNAHMYISLSILEDCSV